MARLLYLDEAGTDARSAHVCVMGVLVHGDGEWPEIDRRIRALVEKHIPAADRLGFVFHATDIYHGSKYFDRRKPEWQDEAKRHVILEDLAEIIGDLNLPVMVGVYDRAKMQPKVEAVSFTGNKITHALLTAATLDCLLAADKWLRLNAPDELATVVHENGNDANKLIRDTVRIARSADYLQLFEDGVLMKDLPLPLQRIIDTVHFVEKQDARLLQLADLCAFVAARAFRDAPVPRPCAKIICQQMKWFTDALEK